MGKMTVAQALVKFLDNQYVEFDGKQTKFVDSIFTIFGHGIAVGLGEALDAPDCRMTVRQGRNEQGMCHAAIAFAKQSNRRRIIPCASSVGPGAANMVTAAATATANNIPLLLFPADTYASRQPDPVLQQIEQPHDLSITTNDAFRPVCRYWDRITRPEQLMSAMINAMRVLTDPAETGAVCIALPQDCEGEAFDYPDYFFQRRVYRITRPVAVEEELADVVDAIAGSKRPLVIVGGGVRYSEAGEAVECFCDAFGIPYGETQGGKSACISSHSMCVGGVGTTGTLAANNLAKDADCVIAIGSRLSDFTTSSKWQFQNPDVKIVTINVSRFHAMKMDAVHAVGDAKVTTLAVHERLAARGYHSAWGNRVAEEKAAWDKEMDRLRAYSYGEGFEPIVKPRDMRTIPEFVELTHGTITQTAGLLAIREAIDPNAIMITAGGSLPSCMQRIWTTDVRDTYHAEYAYSCMGYECEAVLGCKLAEPEREVYTVVGDGSFQMLHSEMATAMQEHVKVNIIVFDNCGFGCINNLEMTHGIGSMATEFRYRDGQGNLLGDLIPVDYAMIGAGYGFKTYTVRTVEELRAAIADARGQELPVLIDAKVLPKTMTDGYNSWWNVGLAETSQSESVRECWENDVKPGRESARKY
ncbi:3D-(3,5/4)-trihydroxycyclohexane-1,2-dione acylhydrolase (decyclizing) [Collinsella stercoris]|uniref:3D-(3,5/4)-trihydroxycyclohexane-1,2-dione acylhydrolase (decyclizing) n=1 Tax=Collinsella stercoris TaxID=147206 RepID=UPI00248F29A6|nr:3D-(3,5/4)-trihydroxycyclohexane-1,2-dione acylhydrolase (decyclizing) [Collinsella stercoris]